MAWIVRQCSTRYTSLSEATLSFAAVRCNRAPYCMLATWFELADWNRSCGADALIRRGWIRHLVLPPTCPKPLRRIDSIPCLQLGLETPYEDHLHSASPARTKPTCLKATGSSIPPRRSRPAWTPSRSRPPQILISGVPRLLEMSFRRRFSSGVCPCRSSAALE